MPRGTACAGEYPSNCKPQWTTFCCTCSCRHFCGYGDPRWFNSLQLSLQLSFICMSMSLSLDWSSEVRLHPQVHMTKMLSDSFCKLPHVYLSDHVMPTVHKFPAFSNSELRFCGWWTMQYQSHLTVWHMSTVSLYPVVYSHMQCAPRQLLRSAGQLPVCVHCFLSHLETHAPNWQ